MKVFITGASSGLGASLARLYGSRGAVLGLVARRSDALAAVAASCGGEAHLYGADVGDVDAMQSAASRFLAHCGAPDVVVANAGISVGTSGGAPEDVAVLAAVLKTNVVGLAATITPFVEPMRKAGRGTLVCIASIAGFRGIPGSGAYCASKSAAIAWMESLRVELHGSGVRVVTVCPGYIDTPMTAVNRFDMPFLLSAEEAAVRIARSIERGPSLAIVPWQMRVAMSAIRLAPPWVFDRMFARAPRKPRGLPM